VCVCLSLCVFRGTRYEQLLLNAALGEMGDATRCPREACGYPIFRDAGAPTLGASMHRIQTGGRAAPLIHVCMSMCVSMCAYVYVCVSLCVCLSLAMSVCVSLCVCVHPSYTGVCSRCQYAFCMLCRHGSHGVQPCLPRNLAEIIDRYRNGSAADKADLVAQYVQRERLTALLPH
jgi:hypothetical protein